MRYILHSDLNYFYASVESLYNPEIRNKAVVVVGDEEKRHGIVLAKNYIAKDYNIKTGDTVWEARRKSGVELVCVPARFDLYLTISKMVKSIYREYSDRVESFGIDEAWIDITHLCRNFDDAKRVADNIRCRIITEIGLTVSIGVSFYKIFAKLASDLKKPNATTVIMDTDYKDIVWKLPVEDLLYVGRATKQKFDKANIKTIGDLANTDIKYLKLILGKVGLSLWDFANGNDVSQVSSIYDKEKVKSIGNSTTCPKDLNTLDEVKSIIYMLSESVVERMNAKNLYATTISLWVKDTELKSFDRQMHVRATNVVEDVANACFELFRIHYDWKLDVRALGVRVSNFTEGKIQYDLFKDRCNLDKNLRLDNVMEDLRSRFGYNIIRRGNILLHTELASLSPKSETHIIHPVGFFKAK